MSHSVLQHPKGDMFTSSIQNTQRRVIESHAKKTKHPEEERYSFLFNDLSGLKRTINQYQRHIQKMIVLRSPD